MQNWVAVWWYTPTTVKERAFTVSLPSARKVLLQTTSTVCRWKVAPVVRLSRGGLPPAVWFETLLAMEVVNQTRANDTLPPDMIFGQAQIISISAYTPLFIISAVLNLRVLRKLWQTKQRNGLSRLNQLLMHLVLADLSVSLLLVSHWLSIIYPYVNKLWRLCGVSSNRIRNACNVECNCIRVFIICEYRMNTVTLRDFHFPD